MTDYSFLTFNWYYSLVVSVMIEEIEEKRLGRLRLRFLIHLAKSIPRVIVYFLSNREARILFILRFDKRNDGATM